MFWNKVNIYASDMIRGGIETHKIGVGETTHASIYEERDAREKGKENLSKRTNGLGKTGISR
jgi:hypothetical protein